MTESHSTNGSQNLILSSGGESGFKSGSVGWLPVANSVARSFSAVSRCVLVGLVEVAADLAATRLGTRGRDGDAPEAHAMVAGRRAAAGRAGGIKLI